MKYVLAVLFLIPFSSSADVVVSSSVSTDTAWSSEYGTYVIEGQMSIATGTTLTVLPGTIIKVKSNSGIFVDGKIIADSSGTSTPIIFTSFDDDEYGGDTNQNSTSTIPNERNWLGIVFNRGSIGEFNNVVVKYSGQTMFGTNMLTGLIVNSANLTIQNSLLSSNGRHGFANIGGEINMSNSIIENNVFGGYVESGKTNLNKNIIRNNSLEGIHASIYGELNLVDNQFVSNQSTGLVGAGVNFVHTGNTSLDLTNRGFNMLGVPLDGQFIGGKDLPLIISGGFISIASGTSVTLLPGTIIKFDYMGSLEVSGNLNINGEKNNKVIFTSIKDDSVSGDTNNDGILTSPSQNDLQGLVFSRGSTSNISNATFKYSLRGLVNNGGDISIKDSIFSTSTQLGVHVYDGNLGVENSQFLSQGGIINYGPNTVNAVNNWWGSNTGPYDTSTSSPSGSGSSVSLNVAYKPWLRRDPSLSNPVIIIPGIMGSYLLKDDGSDDEVWMNLSKMTFSANDDYLDELKMSGEGKGNIGIVSGGLVSKINNFDFFKGLVTLISNNAANQVFEYSYDWRMKVEENQQSFSDYIDTILLQTGASKVDIVAHSMGGLIVKDYLNGRVETKINKFIDIATPHVGAPKAYKILSFGDNFGFEKFGLNVLNPKKIKSISQNMPSVYQLLPSENYFDNSNTDYSYYIFNGIDNSKRLNFEETKQYLKDQGRNSLLIDRADELHKEIDNLNLANYGIETYNIVGCGTPTLGKIYVLDQENGDYDYAIQMINGDGTVPLRSAEAMTASKTYYVNEAQHAIMPSSSGVKELVTSILKGEASFDSTSYPNILETSESCGVPDGRLVSFHSPITLQITDQYGNYAGPNDNGDIENNIESLVYEVIEDTKFAYLPNGTNYTVYGESTGSGDFDIRVETIVNGEVARTDLYNDIQLTENTKVQFDINNNRVESVYIDSDGNGIADLKKEISTSTIGFMEPIALTESLVDEHTFSGFGPQSRRQNIEEYNTKINSAIDNKVSSPTISLDVVEVIKFKQTEVSPGIKKVVVYNNSNLALVNESVFDHIKNWFRNLIGWFKSKL